MTGILALENGNIYTGKPLGYQKTISGEIVFNTAMTGYQQVITDPSYAGQIVVFSYPHIGNVGINLEDNESDQIWVEGIIIQELPTQASNWRAVEELDSYCKKYHIPILAGLNVRAITQLIRTEGCLHACLSTEKKSEFEVLQQAQTFQGLNELDLVKKVTPKKNYKLSHVKPRHRIVVLDLGAKKSILHQLVAQQCEVIGVSASTSADKILQQKPNGIVISNGPGDPRVCAGIIKEIKRLLQSKIPILGICLGHQLIGLALGAEIIKMKFGHHGVNHPVQALDNKKVFISSQNHNYAIDFNSLPHALVATHRSLFDDSLQGFKHRHKPVWGLQGHPEAGPGPYDLHPFFNQFIQSVTEHQAEYVEIETTA